MWVVAAAVAVLVCWKPANIFFKLMLKHYSVNMPADNANGFNAGALIGTIGAEGNVCHSGSGSGTGPGRVRHRQCKDPE